MRIPRAILPAIALAAAAWSATLTFGGGISVLAPWGRISSRDPVRPLAIAIAAALLFTCIDIRWRTAAMDGPRSRRLARWLVIVIAVLEFVAGIRFGTFTAGGSDPSGYVSESELWREGRLIRPVPAWVAAAPWPDAVRTATPLGYLPGPAVATQVPSYPPGLPLLMATAHLLGGSDAEYLVVPLSAALLVWATFLLGARLTSSPQTGSPGSSLADEGHWGGLVAATLVGTSPPFLMWLVMPMSDLPVAACWTVALVCALAGTGSGAAGAGAATALAITIRPNLAPLAAIVAFVLAACDVRPRRALLVYAGLAGSGALFMAVFNDFLYGSPLSSGYGDVRALYSWDFMWPNLQRYSSWFLSTATPIPLAGLLAPRWAAAGRQRLITAAIVIGFPAVTLGLYLAYLPFEDWSYLRFLLPAYPALFAGLAMALTAVVRQGGASLPIRVGWAAGVALLALRGLDYSNAATDLANTEPRYRHVAVTARETPANAIFLSFQHSGSLRYYTGRDILRWDLMDRAGVDAALDYLEGRGYHVYWVGDRIERESVRARFGSSRLLTRIESGRRKVISDVWLVDLQPGE